METTMWPTESSDSASLTDRHRENVSVTSDEISCTSVVLHKVETSRNLGELNFFTSLLLQKVYQGALHGNIEAVKTTRHIATSFIDRTVHACEAIPLSTMELLPIVLDIAVQEVLEGNSKHNPHITKSARKKFLGLYQIIKKWGEQS